MPIAVAATATAMTIIVDREIRMMTAHSVHGVNQLDLGGQGYSVGGPRAPCVASAISHLSVKGATSRPLETRSHRLQLEKRRRGCLRHDPSRRAAGVSEARGVVSSSRGHAASSDDGACDRMTPPTPAFDLDDLTKVFGDVVAVDHVSLQVPNGSFYGLLGPNGAGKSTTILLAVGLLRPDAGSARILGTDVWEDPARAKGLVGVLPDGMMLPERLTGREVLTWLGLLRGLDSASVRDRADDLLGIMGLLDAEETLVIDYSAGMRKKIGLATALIHAPRLLVLDEPLEAIDPVSAATIKTVLSRYVDGGGSVVVSSHVLPVVEQLCDQVAIIDRGSVVASGTIDEVRRGRSLEERFVELVGDEATGHEELPWLVS